MRATVSQTLPTRSSPGRWLIPHLPRVRRLDLLIVAVVGAVAAFLLTAGDRKLGGRPT